MNKQYEIYKKTNDICEKYNYASYVISFDVNTVCPKKNKEYAYENMNYFSGEVYKLKTSDEYYNCLKYLVENQEDLNEVEKIAIKKEYEELTKERKLPQEKFFEMMDITTKTSLSWEEARETLDFSEFEKHLDVLVKFYKEYIEIMKDKYEGYNVLLDDMEDDFTIDKYDEFFNLLEKELLPVVKQILALPKKYNEKIKEVSFDIDKQKKLTRFIADIMGYTNEVGYIGETIHPFTNSNNINDVRTTTAYDEYNFIGNLYSVMHEIGHALYELQNDPKFNQTVLFGGTSCAIHESQSRFYENYLGRSKEFISFIYPKLVEIFPEELKGFTVDDVYYYVNDVTAQPIRIDADELTYPFHVLIRYKIEKMLFNNEIEAKDICDVFNKLMNEYLGITPENKKVGGFQDVHWTSGFGYFPTYALGSAMSAQFLKAMEKDFNPFEDLKEGNFVRINKWLKEHVHKYGRSVKNLEVVKLATNEEFNPKYYVEYLKNKFAKIYNL